MVSSITKQFRPTFWSQLVGKLYFFSRRSWWRYLLAALLLSLARPTLLHSFWLTLLVLATGLLSLGLAVVVLSSYLLRRRQSFEAEVTFRAARIDVQPARGAPAQTHDWRWVRRASENGRLFFLEVQSPPRLVLLLDKQRLTAAEIAAFRTWLAARKSS